ncbi:hypothetical protein L6R52_27920 [Myxococcota bacterium]|nr:hypothetical protein [Myxococcota bacterium]
MLAAEVGERGFEVRVFEPGGHLSRVIFRDERGALVSLEEPITPAVPRPSGTLHRIGDPGVDVIDEITVAHAPLGIGSTCFVARCEAAPSPVACCAEELRKNLRREDGAMIVWRYAGHGLWEPSSEGGVSRPAR